MVLSLWRGFMREMISLIGLIAAFLIASRLSGQAGDYLGQWVDNATVADIAGFALVFLLVNIAIGIIGIFIQRLIDIAALTATDRTLGIFFGAARGLLLIALCFLVYTSYTEPNGDWFTKSKLAPYAVELGDMLGSAIPEEYPFSRQGAARYRSPQGNTERIKDMIPNVDKNALKSIIEQNTK